MAARLGLLTGGHAPRNVTTNEKRVARPLAGLPGARV
jgi:hypothetical protein